MCGYRRLTVYMAVWPAAPPTRSISLFQSPIFLRIWNWICRVTPFDCIGALSCGCPCTCGHRIEIVRYFLTRLDIVCILVRCDDLCTSVRMLESGGGGMRMMGCARLKNQYLELFWEVRLRNRVRRCGKRDFYINILRKTRQLGKVIRQWCPYIYSSAISIWNRAVCWFN